MLEALVAAMAMGLFLVSFGFALGRASRPGAMDFYIAGQVLIITSPVFYLVKFRDVKKTTGFWISSTVGLAGFLVVQCYSPLQFRFEDEFQHVGTAQLILSTHHLFGFNPALPVSPQYPGMEIATTAISSLCHLSIYASGTIIVGLAHVLVAVLVYSLAIELKLTPRSATFSVVILSVGYDFQFFLSYFAYQTFAVPFLIATLLVTLKMLRASRSDVAAFLGVSAVSLGFITIVSHHVTSYFLIAMLIFIVATVAIQHGKTLARGLAILVVLGVLLAIWDLGIATDTVHYLSQIRVFLFESSGISSSVKSIGTASQQVGNYVTNGNIPNYEPTPIPLRVLADLSAAILALLIPAGVWRIWRGRRAFSRLLWSFVAMCGLYYILALIFLFSPGADQLVGRAQALVLIPVGLIAAIALDSAMKPAITRRKHRIKSSGRAQALIAAAAVLVVVVGGILSAWPPYPGKLPGPYQVAAYERSTDQRTIAVGAWMAHMLGPGKNFAADHREALMLAAMTGDNATPDTAALFEAESFRSSDVAVVEHQHTQYVIADYRMTMELPAEGSYFINDPLAGLYARPLPKQDLDKFNAIPGISRIFDDGTIAIFDIRNSPYYGKIHG